MAGTRKKATASLKLNRKLILAQWMLSQFGAESLEDLAKDLTEEGLDESNTHHYYHVLAGREGTVVSPEVLLGFDRNIVSHTRRINDLRQQNGDAAIVWKPFQYLALLFSEVYLDHYFRDPQALLDTLNSEIGKHNAAVSKTDALSLFSEDAEAWSQVNKLAFWMATGSGKTLIMHANILQYLYYLARHGRQREVNRILLLTPHEELSQQHLRNLKEAGIHAEIFNKDRGTLFSSETVEILEVTKLRETMGDKTIAIEALEGNNLVLVDEGHRGASSGKEGAWMKARNALCEQGFSFEYSATFSQAVTKSSELTDLYARCILIDYSYRYFHGDGYGKDYRILNLESDKPSHLKPYLVASLLSFFQQMHLYQNEADSFRPFQIENPLWMFVGTSVVKGFGKTDASDVIQILQFLQRYITNRKESIQLIGDVLDHGIVSNSRNLTAEQFPYLATLRSEGLEAADIYAQTLSTVFNAPSGGELHVSQLSNTDGEIALRVGADNPPFGLINVGDPRKLLILCEDKGMATEKSEFGESLFALLDDPGSPVTVLIGAKKFAVGWSSWRVSTMGLMNVGRSEGAQIIQLFGRGVRLKGYGMSLKRSRYTDIPKDITLPTNLRLLETLGVFGIRAKYMDAFHQHLLEEGISDDTERTTLSWPIVATQPPASLNRLKTIRRKAVPGESESANPFVHRGPTHVLGHKTDDPFLSYVYARRIVINWYPKIKAIQSDQETPEIAAPTDERRFSRQHLDFLDLDRLYLEVEQFKTERRWHNLSLTVQGLQDALADDGWYTIRCPKAVFGWETYANVGTWQEMAEALLKTYVERAYKFYARQWELPRLEYAELTEDNPNLTVGETASGREYQVSISASRTVLVTQIRKLIADFRKKPTSSLKAISELKVSTFQSHLYAPLLHVTTKDIDVFPAVLNEGEFQFIEDLRKYCEEHQGTLAGKELYLLRNQSRNRGVGFLEAQNFHPDFMLWVLAGSTQHLAFIDPKGLRMLQPDDEKIGFHETVKEVEARLDDPAVVLHSFILSKTSYKDVKKLWKREKSELERQNVLFQEDSGHIQRMLAAIDG